MGLSKIDLSNSGSWLSRNKLKAKGYTCGFCGDKVSSVQGYFTGREAGLNTLDLYICPSCNAPTLFTIAGDQFPEALPGNSVPNVPEDLSNLFDEARNSAAVGAYTAAVMICRKMLMRIAVEQGAKQGEPYASYVDYLVEKGYIPPTGKEWADYVRKLGHEANHDIQLMQREDALALITFVEMILRFVYEFPSMMPTKD